MQQGFCVGQSRLTYSSGHGDFKQDQEAHRCNKASVVDITDFLMVVVMVTLKQDQATRFLNYYVPEQNFEHDEI